MTDQKNKQQQQPRQGNKPNGNQSGQGRQSPSGSSSKSSGSTKTAMPDSDEDPVTEADFGDDQPGKSIQIDDNPEETKKKIPNMQKRH